MTIVLGADHGGFELKEQVKKWLMEQGYTVEDAGNTILDQDDDYPDFAFAAAQRVSKLGKDGVGILLCRSGGGMIIAANKVKGIRAIDVFNETSALHAKTNNNANVISIGADWTTLDEAKTMIKKFLDTPFQGEVRHARRIQKIAQKEQQLFK